MNTFPNDPLVLGVEWVQARLDHDPRTRHLHVSVRAQGDTLVLEGHAPTITEKLWAGQVARRGQAWGQLDNQIDVYDGAAGGLEVPALSRRPGRPQGRAARLAVAHAA